MPKFRGGFLLFMIVLFLVMGVLSAGRFVTALVNTGDDNIFRLFLQTAGFFYVCYLHVNIAIMQVEYETLEEETR